GHPLVRLVVEVVDGAPARVAASGAGERRDRAGLAARDFADDVVERDLRVRQQERAAGDGRDERNGVAVRERGVARRVLAVDGVQQPVGLVAEVELAPDVADRRSLDLLLRPARALAQSGEKPHGYWHRE